MIVYIHVMCSSRRDGLGASRRVGRCELGISDNDNGGGGGDDDDDGVQEL